MRITDSAVGTAAEVGVLVGGLWTAAACVLLLLGETAGQAALQAAGGVGVGIGVLVLSWALVLLATAAGRRAVNWRRHRRALRDAGRV